MHTRNKSSKHTRVFVVAGKSYPVNPPHTNLRITDSLKQAARGLQDAMSAFIGAAETSDDPQPSNSLTHSDECRCRKCEPLRSSTQLHVHSSDYSDMMPSFTQRIQAQAKVPEDRRLATQQAEARKRQLRALNVPRQKLHKDGDRYKDMLPTGIVGYMRSKAS